MNKKLVATPVYQEKFLSKSECEELIKLGRRYTRVSAGVGHADNINDYRSSEVGWIHPEQDTDWIYKKIASAVSVANKFYRFHLHGFNDRLQVARYDKGGHYSWHMDIGESTPTRKLSVSVQLSQPCNYEGGELEFSGNLSGFETPKRQGTVIFFPSYLTHRVAPVTHGVRWSLVTWIHGLMSFQ